MRTLLPRPPRRVVPDAFRLIGATRDVQPLEIRRLITSRFSVERCVDATEAALTEARAAER